MRNFISLYFIFVASSYLAQLTGNYRPINGDVAIVVTKQFNKNPKLEGKAFTQYNEQNLPIAEGRIIKHDTIIE